MRIFRLISVLGVFLFAAFNLFAAEDQKANRKMLSLYTNTSAMMEVQMMKGRVEEYNKIRKDPSKFISRIKNKKDKKQFKELFKKISSKRLPKAYLVDGRITISFGKINVIFDYKDSLERIIYINHKPFKLTEKTIAGNVKKLDEFMNNMFPSKKDNKLARVILDLLIPSAHADRYNDRIRRERMKKNRSDYETVENYVQHDIQGDIERPASFATVKDRNIFNFYLIGAANIILYNNLKEYDKSSVKSDRDMVLSKNTQWVFEYLEYEKNQCENEYLNPMLRGDRHAARRFKGSNNLAGILNQLMTHSTFEDFYEKSELHGRYSHIPSENRNTHIPKDKASREEFISNYYSTVDYIKNGQSGLTISVDTEMVRRRHIWEMYKKFFGEVGADEDITRNVRRIPNMGCDGYYRHMDSNINGYAVNLSEKKLRDAKNSIGLSREYVNRMWRRDICPRLEQIQSCYQRLMSDLGVFDDNRMEVDGMDQDRDYEARKDYYRSNLENAGAINK